MKPDKNENAAKNEKVARFALSLICFTSYITFVSVVITSAFNTNPYDFFLS